MLNWDDLQFFLAIARQHTLSAAARELGVTQPTVGRRLASLEATLGAQLFERSAAGLTLSEVGRAVLTHAEQMQAHALHAENLARGRAAGLRGDVRITATEWVIRSLLGPALGPLLAKHPELRIELLADARHLSLIKRDADIALRASRFTHPEVVQREVAKLEFGLYASEAYLSRFGVPDFARGCEGHAFIQMTEGLANLVDYEWLPPIAAQARVAVRTNGREPMLTMASAGIGIAVLPRLLADGTAGLCRLSTPVPCPARKLWLGLHRAARSTPRVRATANFLVEVFRDLRSSDAQRAELA